jgi:hypothetical protein
MQTNFNLFYSIIPETDPDFWRALRNAPRAKALNGSVLVDLAFMYPHYAEPKWWPLRDLLAGYVPS